MSLVCTGILSVCHSYVLVYHPYLTRMCSYIIRMSLVCHPYVLVCTRSRMYSYVIRMSLVCGFIMERSYVICMSLIYTRMSYPEPLITSFSFLPLYELHCNFLRLYFGHVIKRGSIQDMIRFTLIFHTSLFFCRPTDTTGVRGFVALNNSCEFSFNVQVSEIFWEFFKGSSRTQL